MVCQFLLYNKVNQLYIYIYPHISSLLRLPPTLCIPPLQVVTKHRADLAVLCGCFPLAIYFTFGPCHSLTSSQLSLPPPCVLKSILYVCVFIPVLPLVPAHFNCVFSSQAGLWTVFTLGGVGSKAAAAPEVSSPLANQSLLLLLVLANLTDAADAPNPYRQAIMSFKNTQGLWCFFSSEQSF